MLNLNFIPFPEFHTDRLFLRKLKLEDAADLLEIRSNPDTMKYMARPVLRTIDEAMAQIEKVLKRFDDASGIEWGIVEKEGRKLIGTVSFWRIDKDNYRGELGYIINKHWQGKGIMSEVLPVVIRFGFETINLHSMEADIDPLNIASARLLEKNKFRREAFFRENRFFNDMYIDSIIYSLVKSIDYK